MTPITGFTRNGRITNMSSDSRRTSPLPRNWVSLRRVILLRDQHRCQWGIMPADLAPPGQCSRVATDVDHMNDPTDHDPASLRALCAVHHRLRTSRNAGAASGRAKKAMLDLRNRPQGKHPGLIDEEDAGV